MPFSELDKAFELIEEGNSLKKSGDDWKAADSFGQAMAILEKLAGEAPSLTEEEKKIAELYREKACYYRQTARESLIQAMQQEKEQDDSSSERDNVGGGGSTSSQVMLSDQEAECRTLTFSLLFSKPPTSVVVEDVREQTNKLEHRLMELNASLPSGFKTDKERLASINRGLGRLGLSLYSNSNNGSSNDVEPPPSEEEQVAQIIAQAKDEVRYPYEKPTEAALGGTNLQPDAPPIAFTNGCADDDDTSDSEDSDYSVSMDDLVDEPVLKNKKAIQRKVVKAQVKLAELIALLNAEPELKLGADARGESDESNVDEPDGKAGIDLEHGRATLVAARNYLNKAVKEWPIDTAKET